MIRWCIVFGLSLSLASGCGAPGRDVPTAPEEGADSAGRPYSGPAAPYRGYDAIQVLLEDRLVAGPADFELSAYFGPPLVPPTVTGTVATQEELAAFSAYAGARARRRELTVLLGDWGGSGPANSFRNGHPNGLSLLIWENAFRGFAEDLTHLALGDEAATLALPGLALHPPAAAALQRLATWPDDSARSVAALEALWEVLVRADAPTSEREAWIALCLDPEYSRSSASEVLPDILTAIFLDPYFLLTR